MEDVFCQELSWKIDGQGLTVGLSAAKMIANMRMRRRIQMV
jgi:hypothetical protein